MAASLINALLNPSLTIGRQPVCPVGRVTVVPYMIDIFPDHRRGVLLQSLQKVLHFYLKIILKTTFIPTHFNIMG